MPAENQDHERERQNLYELGYRGDEATGFGSRPTTPKTEVPQELMDRLGNLVSQVEQLANKAEAENKQRVPTKDQAQVALGVLQLPGEHEYNSLKNNASAVLQDFMTADIPKRRASFIFQIIQLLMVVVMFWNTV